MDSKICRHIIAEGLVQGVGFRMSMRQFALANGVNGWVKNNTDGSVEAVIEGEKKAVEKVVSWCKKGPYLSEVTGIEVSKKEYRGRYSGFQIY